MENYLLGKIQGRLNITGRRFTRSFYRGGPILTSALSGIEQALWDILEVVRGSRVSVAWWSGADRIRIYAHAHGADKEQLCKRARELVDMGFNLLKTALKRPSPLLKINSSSEIAWSASLRYGRRWAQSGSGVDFHGRFSPTMSKRLIKELEPLYPYFVGNPVARQHGSAGGVEELNDCSVGHWRTHLHQVGFPGFD